MSEEVKRLHFFICHCENGPHIDSNIDSDGEYVAYADFQSERQARLEAEAKLQNAVRSSILWQSEFNNAEARLKALEDAISDLGYKVAVWQMYPGKTLDILSQAIQESRTRRQNDDTTI